VKKLLLAASALALINTAHAAQTVSRLPTAMLGNWCEAKEPSGRDSLTVYERATSKQVEDDPGCIVLNQDGTHGREDGCKFGRKTYGSGDYIIYMHCWNAGEEHKQPLSAAILELNGSQLRWWWIGTR
jgi:hypothetical protein